MELPLATKGKMKSENLQGGFLNKVACPSSGDCGEIFGGYVEEIWRTFGGSLEEMCRKFGGR